MASSRKAFNALAKALALNKTQVSDLLGNWNPPDNVPTRNKFGAKAVEIDGIKFQSKKEAEYYGILKIKKQTGQIADFRIKVKYDLVVNGIKIGRYTSDFDVVHLDGRIEVVDVKGGNATKTEAYRLRKRLMWACHGIEVQEV